MKLGLQGDVSPDGKWLAFVWAGDIWVGSTEGGHARRLTEHPAAEWTPKFSPDGDRIAFVSERDSGTEQIFSVPVEGGVPAQWTDHSEGYYLLDWFPDGKSVLARCQRDHLTSRRGGSLYRVWRDRVGADELLFEAEASRASVSPDGKRLLLTREGVSLYRKGYRGSQASQIWMYDLEKGKFHQLVREPGGARSPLWKPDGLGFYFVAQRGGAFNLVERDLVTGDDVQLTAFRDDGVMRPALSADGATLVFRRGFDFWRIDPAARGDDGQPVEAQRIEFHHRADLDPSDEVRRLLRSATDVAFSADGLEMALVAGGDVWVMDTVLREPRQVTDTVAEEREVLMSKDGESIYFLSDTGLECNLWRARRADPQRYWWQNSAFERTQLTEGDTVISGVSLSPDGKHLAFVRGAGDLWVTGLDAQGGRRVVGSWDAPNYDWSPDGRYIAYAVYDNDFNHDVWIVPVDGSMLPYNVSRHPSWDSSPRWSPDGKLLAFTGSRRGDEVDLFYVWLHKGEDERSTRERSEAKAVETIKSARKNNKPATPKKPSPQQKPEPQPAAGDDTSQPGAALAALMRGLSRWANQADGGDADAPDKDAPAAADPPKPAAAPRKPDIDFDGLAARVRRISLADSSEGSPLWSPDSKKLAFRSKIKGVDGLFSVEFPDKLAAPSLITPKQVSHARWLAKDDRIVWLERGVPGSISRGKLASYPFSAAQSFDRRAKFRVAFQQIWRAMRDTYYDATHNNLDWPAMLTKYEPAAAAAADLVAFESVVAMLLGELNGSHLGFRANPALAGVSPSPAAAWKRETAHLGARWEERDGKLVVASVIDGSPADRAATRLEPGDVVVSVDGEQVSSRAELLPQLNGVPGRRVEVVVERDGDTLEPMRIPTISFAAARALVKDEWIKENRRRVEEASGGRLGYLYVARMMWGEFEKFEREIYAIGAGKDGIIIDVRDNGGGFTADHLLTVLTPAEHALTVPRGGGVGYPGDRRVYGTWSKPIVVLCNQNSFSNAEIFAHAVKVLGRGKLVGVPTAGGVISTGSKSIMDVGSLRIPFRGWFKIDDGEDMELNGAVPDVIVWPRPGALPAGEDRQLAKAIEVLEAEVEAAEAAPTPRPRRASERRRR